MDFSLLSKLVASDWAAWVQAIGTIGAVWATGKAVNKAHQLQVKHVEHQKYSDYTQFLEATFQLVGGATSVARKIFDAQVEGQSPPRDLWSMTAELEALRNALARVDVTRFDQFEFIEATLVSESILRRLLRTVEYVQSPGFSVQLDGYALRNEANTARLELETRANRLRDALATRTQKPTNDQNLFS